MQPTIGRIVHYTLTAKNAEEINRRRTSSKSIAERIQLVLWPIGAQAHIGNEVKEGQIVPMLIVAVWPNDTHGVNGQAFLDGTDSLWVTSVSEGTIAGTWAWPPKV